jgi:HSP20 family protein
MFGRTPRWNSCCTPASAALRDAFSFPAFAVGVAKGSADCDSGTCTTDSTELPTYRLPVDVSEEKRENGKVWVIVANLPGFKKDEIAIELKEGLLSIDAKRTPPVSPADATVYRRERRVANLTRQVQLPETAADDGISAVLADGVLTIVVPQKPEAQPRKIVIG